MVPPSSTRACCRYAVRILPVSANDGASIPLELEEVTQFGKVIRLEKANTFGAVACIDMFDPLLDYLYTGHQDAILDRILIKTDDLDANDLKIFEESLLGLWKNVQLLGVGDSNLWLAMNTAWVRLLAAYGYSSC
jgi:hypothetical protein